jgi:uroporphyrin-III C-methyltransferase / precorrin-2 dehydrogenase / sirohydrochlorin ferrochelatase
VFPVMLNVRGRRCLVVGGGGVALRKVSSLLQEGALVTAIAPEPSQPLLRLAAQGRVELERRSYRDGEASAYALVFAATDDRAVNARVSHDAESAGLWVNVADDPELCSFQLPARVQRGSLQVAVASAGEAPFAVRRLRQLLDQRLGPEWGQWLESAARFRERVRAAGVSPGEQEACFDRFFVETVDRQKLTARVPPPHEVGAWLEGLGAPGAAPPEPSETRRFPEAAGAGQVSLVGAGPGDPGLLTLRGRDRLLNAQAVVYDRLAEPAMPCDIPAQVELYCVGKEAGHHPVPQEEINALLVRLASDGKRVVRLKGGDPYVFGRGSEEAEALRDAGVPFEVVPGVTSGIAAPAYAGIPVTHRREAVRVTLLTAHESAKDGGPQVRWDLLAADPHATLVGYMGVTSLPTVVSRLLAAGMDPLTPAAVVERGTTSGQRVVRASLVDLPDRVVASGLQAPALFVIGPTAHHADRLGWLDDRPLAGTRLVVAPGAVTFASGLEQAGAELVLVPVPLTPAARVVMAALPLTGCVLHGAAEVDAVNAERGDPGWPHGVAAWCVGQRAATRAQELGWEPLHQIPAGADAIELVRAIAAARTRAPRG